MHIIIKDNYIIHTMESKFVDSFLPKHIIIIVLSTIERNFKVLNGRFSVFKRQEGYDSLRFWNILMGNFSNHRLRFEDDKWVCLFVILKQYLGKVQQDRYKTGSITEALGLKVNYLSKYAET